jgi:hypothetical protein
MFEKNFSLDSIPGALTEADQLPQVDWALVRQRIAATKEAPHDDLWRMALRQWLEALGKAFGRFYRVWESQHFVVLCASPDPKSVLDYCELARTQAISVLGDPAASPPSRLPVLVLAPEMDFFRYLRRYREGPLSEIFGACIRGDLTHIVLRGREQLRLKVLHELVHAYFPARQPPRWLDEGIAQYLAAAIAYHQHPTPEARLNQEQRLIWHERIQQFWSGAAFYAPERTLRVGAYALSWLIVRSMIRLSLPQLRDFAFAASAEDAGDRACLAVYGFGLETWASRILGDGQWAPDPASWAYPPVGPQPP